MKNIWELIKADYRRKYKNKDKDYMIGQIMALEMFCGLMTPVFAWFIVHVMLGL